MKVIQLYDYNKHKGEPIDLHEFLNLKGTKENLKDKRCLYVVKPNSDPMLKFGIAGLDGGTSAYGRLLQYVNLYGKQSELNQCAGVQLLYLVGTKYNKNVETKNSWVFKKEKYIIDHFKFERIRDENGLYVGRGRERVLAENLKKLIRVINDTSNKTFDDVETERRKSERLKQSELVETDRVVKITDHYTAPTGRSKTRYRVHWNRPYVLTQKRRTKQGIETTQKEISTTDETAKKIATYTGGQEALELYRKSHSKEKFRD